MVKKQALQLHDDYEDKLYQKLLKELDENPHFSSANLAKNSNIEHISKKFVHQLFTNVQSDSFPSISKQTISPLLGLWHNLLKDHMQEGFSTKDMAILIYALKTSLQSLFKTAPPSGPLSQEKLSNFEQLLDLLGILTFEMYSIENEKLIVRQNQQIKYLQTQESKLMRQMVGSSPAINQVYKAIGLVLENDLTVLLEGESGTGKDLIANTIHSNSKRSHKPFIVINCGAIPRELIESELFGHEKGAFTGADSKKIGKFELAHEGTLFLDEIGELPLDLQVKLLRVLQNKEVERIGNNQPIPINVRIIAATNKHLKDCVDAKTFRLDLYYRLNIFPIQIPALRERQDDIIPLTDFFLEKYAKELNIPKPELTQEASQYLLNQYWEGNIRELENTIQRSLVLCQGKPITSAILSIIPGKSLPLLTDSKPIPLSLPDTSSDLPLLSLAESEKLTIERALSLKKGNILQAAKALGVSRTTLYSKMEKYNISMPD